MMRMSDLNDIFEEIETTDSITLTELQKFELEQKERLITTLERLRLKL